MLQSYIELSKGTDAIYFGDGCAGLARLTLPGPFFAARSWRAAHHHMFGFDLRTGTTGGHTDCFNVVDGLQPIDVCDRKTRREHLPSVSPDF